MVWRSCMASFNLITTISRGCFWKSRWLQPSIFVRTSIYSAVQLWLCQIQYWLAIDKQNICFLNKIRVQSKFNSSLPTSILTRDVTTNVNGGHRHAMSFSVWGTVFHHDKYIHYDLKRESYYHDEIDVAYGASWSVHLGQKGGYGVCIRDMRDYTFLY